MALTGEDLVAASRAAYAPQDVPLSAFGLDDNPEVHAAIATIRREMGSTQLDLPQEFPDAGNADHLYSKDGSAAALAASVYDDIDESKVDATLLEAERFLAGVDDPLVESKRLYIRDAHGRFANVHEGGGSSYTERLGTNRHGSGYLEASDHALIGRHLSSVTARQVYNEAYDQGVAARDGAQTPKVLGDKHTSMNQQMAALRRVGREQNIEGGSRAEAVLQDAGFIDGALGTKRRYRRTLTDPSTPGTVLEYIGGSIFGGLLGKDEYDLLTAEEKREYVRDDNGQFARTPGAHVAIGAAVHANGGATLDIMTGHEPKSGYIVAVQGHNKEIPADEFFAHPAKAIAAYVKANRQHLAGTAKNPRMLGLWHDEKNGEVVLDVVEQHHDKNSAVQAGRDRNQQAIWDVANATEIDTGGTGDRAVKAHKAGRPDPHAQGPGNDDRRGDRRLVGDSRGPGSGGVEAFLLSEEKALLGRADPNS